MKLLKKNYLFTLSLSTILMANAQKADSVTTIIFSGSVKNQKKPVKKYKVLDNVIKVAPTGIFVGQFPLMYERRFTDNISVQVGAGLTNQNYIRTVAIETQDPALDSKNNPWYNQFSGSDEAPSIYTFKNNRKANMGTMFSIQPKIYIDDDALDGKYVGFSFSQSTYKFTIPAGIIVNNDLSFSGALQNEQEKVTDFMVHFGSQNLNGHFVLEYSTALGLRKVSGTKYGVSIDNNTNKIYDGFIPYTQTLFNYELAIRIGYAF